VSVIGMILRRSGREKIKNFKNTEPRKNSMVEKSKLKDSKSKKSKLKKPKSKNSKSERVEKARYGKVIVPDSKGDLLKSLSRQHRNLNKQQKIIEKTRLETDKDFRDALLLVNNFKKDFEAHVLLEQVDFYNYLEQMFVDELKRLESLKASRQDLNRVINKVLRYCNRYNSAQKIREGKDKFHKDARDLRRTVKRRSRLEERELFPIFAELE